MKDLIDYQRFQVEALQKRICELKDWLLNKHYAKRVPMIEYSFGLYENNEKYLLIMFMN
jgi:hypothetical protein